MARIAPYHQLSVAEKRAVSLAGMRESPITCPECDMHVTTTDLIAHLEQRCQGRRDPGPGAKWVSHAEALALGVPRQTLSRWVANGFVRVTGGRMDRRYLHGDLARKVAQRRGFRRR